MTTTLLIESPEPPRKNTAAMLELAGYAVLPAADGKRGVAGPFGRPRPHHL